MKNFSRKITIGALLLTSASFINAQETIGIVKTDHKGMAVTGILNKGNSVNAKFTNCNTFDGQNAGEQGVNSTHIGCSAGTADRGYYNVFLGAQTGTVNTSGGYNTFVGNYSGNKNTTSSFNAFFGTMSGQTNTTGYQNTFIGSNSGLGNTSGNNNTFLGHNSGGTNTIGNGNAFVGSYTGYNNNTGENNTFIGAQAGLRSTGSNNVFLGSNVGVNDTSSNRLLIDNSTNSTPLIWGDFATDQLKLNGKVGIGLYAGNIPTTAGGVNVSNYNLFVKGGILTDEIRVRINTTWADYVFNDNYKLKSLSELESYIKEHKHLPNVPSAAQIAKEGVEMGNISKIQQEKIEELTLYIIEQDKQLKLQQKEITELKEAVKNMLNSKK